MKRAEIVLAAVVIAIGTFVGVQVGRRTMARPRPAPTVTQDTSTTIEVATQDGDLVRVRKSTLAAPDAVDPAAVTQLVSEGRSVTYLDEILAARHGNLARWVDRRNDPITVWLQRNSALKDFWPDYPNLARDAFYTWSNAGIPMRFHFVDDSASAEVHLRWIDRFADGVAGKTFWARDQWWWIIGGDIEIALHTSSGQPFDRDAVHAIVLHEVGHLIGLDHTANIENIMAPRVATLKLSAADLRTAHLIYKLPPGAVAGAGGRE